MEKQDIEGFVRTTLRAFLRVDGFVEVRSFLLFLKKHFSHDGDGFGEELVNMVISIARDSFPGIQYCYVHNRSGGNIYLILGDRNLVLEEVRTHKRLPAPSL